MSSAKFSGKSIFVTGAGSGIGRETAIAFAREGAWVIGADISEINVEKTRETIVSGGGRFSAVAVDVSDEKAVTTTFARIADETGGINYAFNNAGMSQSTVLTADITKSEWDHVLSVNVTGVWLCMRAEIKQMLVRGSGVIINTASVLSQHTMALQTLYTTSKHAVLGLTKNAAIEYAASGIRINAVAPGSIPTAMADKTFAGLAEDQLARTLHDIAELHPMKRRGTTREIADAVLFLCSDEAAFITGACLSVDGGWGAI